ncbi:molybdopterin and thiamine biosynthesis E1-like protein [Encephalitozoon intestinalis ATCC 50506]|uniref:Molybdopterin and thiamine biosynthesis E1-like protein n=1 Tax=Encephalitozoon intestinalis (strain ATCC 50506) TaxID=876142 RepID=E0S6C6_ENCIT|nr:molybdopterin and thiamine biosynthesis E1-like protein [Encephalitozoon intestinalis ATCC 50506]ADM11261.1 molybdopterin and thiamine biosynthesis E1-like protein [Encephalitozoon intestinalis ATCC 50506]UTX44929.1 ubiquitin-like modifier-activating enzyme 5 [Encephalitozoon intestinalis]
MVFESDLPEATLERYSRQIIVPGIHVKGQKSLGSSGVLVVGCGGLGSPAILYLLSCGIGRIGLVDFDKVEIHNLQRQVIYTEADVSQYKVTAALSFVKRANSLIKAVGYNEFLGRENVERIVAPYDIVLDCTDSICTRYLLSDCCQALSKSLICGSVLRWEGQLYKLTPDGPCYRCLFPDMRERTLTCEDAGVVGPICGIIGSLQALEAIKTIMGNTEPKMTIYNGITSNFVDSKLRSSRNDCIVCSRKCIPEDLYFPTAKCTAVSDDKATNQNVETINWEDILNNLDSYLLIDVRPPIQHEMFRIKGSVSIPLADLPDKIGDIEASGKKIGVVCKRGISSRKGAWILNMNGIEAFSVNGGVDRLKSLLRKTGAGP